MSLNADYGAGQPEVEGARYVRVGRIFLVSEAARESLLLDLDEAARRNGAKVVAGSSSTEPPERSRAISKPPQDEDPEHIDGGESGGIT